MHWNMQVIFSLIKCIFLEDFMYKATKMYCFTKRETVTRVLTIAHD